MTVQDINSQRNEKGVYSAANDTAGWEAVSRDGIHMITFHQGKWTFTVKGEVNKFYTPSGFARTVGQLIAGKY